MEDILLDYFDSVICSYQDGVTEQIKSKDYFIYRKLFCLVANKSELDSGRILIYQFTDKAASKKTYSFLKFIIRQSKLKQKNKCLDNHKLGLGCNYQSFSLKNSSSIFDDLQRTINLNGSNDQDII